MKRYKILSLERGTYVKIKTRLSPYDNYTTRLSIFPTLEEAQWWIRRVYDQAEWDHFEIVEFEDD